MAKTPIIGKGIVIKDSTINIADNVRTYLGRNPWSSYDSWYNNASFINCNILSPTTNNSSTFVGGDTWLRLSRWSNAAASPTDSKYIGFKDYNLTLNGDPFTTKILKKTTTYNIVTEITTTDKTKTYVGKDYSFNIYTTLNQNAYIATGYKARFIKYSGSIESLKVYSNTLSFSDAKHYYEFVVGFPELNRTECDISKSSASEWLSFLSNKMTTVSGYTGTAYSIDDITSAMGKALSALYSPALTGKTYKNGRSMWWSSSSSSGGKVTSKGRNTDIQFNKGTKISFEGSKNCKVYAICYPGYGNIKITAGGASVSGESASLDISKDCTVTLESLSDTSYLQAIYIIKG